MEEIYLLIMKKVYKYEELLNSLNTSLVLFACGQNRVLVYLSYVFLVFGRLDGLLGREMILFLLINLDWIYLNAMIAFCGWIEG